MSWNNALPFWVYDVQHERFLAECKCCFYDEWDAGYSRSIPKHVTMTMKRWESKKEDQPQKYFKSLLKFS